MLVAEDEARHTRDLGDHFVIHPAHPWWSEAARNAGEALTEGFSYTSKGNGDWLTVEALRALLDE